MVHSDFIAVHPSTSADASLTQQLCVLLIYLRITWVATQKTSVGRRRPMQKDRSLNAPKKPGDRRWKEKRGVSRRKREGWHLCTYIIFHKGSNHHSARPGARHENLKWKCCYNCSPTLRVRTVAKRYVRSSMFTASFILVSCVKLNGNFWNNESWKSCIKSFSIMKLFHLQKPLSKWR